MKCGASSLDTKQSQTYGQTRKPVYRSSSAKLLERMIESLVLMANLETVVVNQQADLVFIYRIHEEPRPVVQKLTIVELGLLLMESPAISQRPSKTSCAVEELM